MFAFVKSYFKPGPHSSKMCDISTTVTMGYIDSVQINMSTFSIILFMSCFESCILRLRIVAVFLMTVSMGLCCFKETESDTHYTFRAS